MRTFVVKMDGEKVRAFNDANMAKLWADKHCKFAKVEIVELREGRLPKAGDPRIAPQFREIMMREYMLQHGVTMKIV